MNVNYEYYRLFYYVCKYHSITRAANVLRMSQPNVTRALNRLEEQLGCKLLVRSTRGVTMTPACGCALPTIPPRRPSVRWGAGWWIFV